jgi:hypothetical protein
MRPDNKAVQYISVVLEKTDRNGQLLVPWLHAVRVPFVAFVWGVCIRESLWFLPLGLLVLVVKRKFPPAQPSMLLIGLTTYFLGHAGWQACFFLSLWFESFLESRCNYLHTKRQVEAVMGDFFSPTANFELQELQVPASVLSGFPSYEVKANVLKFAYERIIAQVPAARSLLVPCSQPLRLFRFWPKDGTRATGAAAAYPIARYSSLIFVRQDFEELSEAQRLQVYHELGHGGLGGTEIFYRPLRWEMVAPFDFLMLLQMFLLTLEPRSIGLRILAGGLLWIAAWSRKSAMDHTKRISIGASEAFADSVALSHPDFRDADKWKLRAENLAKRLKDEMRFIGADHPRYLSLLFRARWLGRWLSLGYIPEYLTQDIDLRIHLAFFLFLFAGYTANPTSAYLATDFWGLVIIIALCLISFSQNGRRTNNLLKQLDLALRNKCTMPNTEPA